MTRRIIQLTGVFARATTTGVQSNGLTLLHHAGTKAITARLSKACNGNGAVLVPAIIVHDF